MYARNTLEQVLAPYTNPESHNAQRHRQIDGQTDGQQDYANSRSYCVAVRSAKNEWLSESIKSISQIFKCPVYERLTLGPLEKVKFAYT